MNFKELENIRKSLNLSISAYAEVIHVTRQTYYNWMKRQEVPFDEAKRILDLLNKNEQLLRYELKESTIQVTNLVTDTKTNYTKQEVTQAHSQDFQMADFLPIEAQAGYLDGLESQTVQELDQMLIPKEFEKGSYLIVEISGDSMNDGSVE